MCGAACRPLAEQAQSRDWDLIVPAPQVRSAAGDRLPGSVTRQMLAEAPVDVPLANGHGA